MPEEDQAEAVADWQLDQELCPRCNNLRADCSDPDVEWYPQRSVDYAQMQQAWVTYMLEEKHKDIGAYHDGTFERWAKERSARYPYHYTDGTSYWVSKYDLTPEADWL